MIVSTQSTLDLLSQVYQSLTDLHLLSFTLLEHLRAVQLPFSEHKHYIFGWNESIQIQFMFSHCIDCFEYGLLNASSNELPTYLDIFFWMFLYELSKCKFIRFFNKNKYIGISKHLI